jgi:4-hydroxy-tetrahydrodipicolinate reductase
VRIGQIGFGRAGRPVASVLLESQTARLEWVLRKSRTPTHRSAPDLLGISAHEPGVIYSVDELSASELLDRSPVDAIVDVSSDTGIFYYGEEARRRGIAVITAVARYPDDTLNYIRAIAGQTRVLCSPNITLGVNFLMLAARILKDLAPDADVEIVEQHFRDKCGVSGTATRMAETLELPQEAIKTIRAGGIIGVHEILFGFPCETVRLKHESISRDAFGRGALFAAEHLQGKPDGLYTMEDLLAPYFHASSLLRAAQDAQSLPAGPETSLGLGAA